MGLEFSKYFNQGLGYRQIEDYEAASECFKKAILYDKNQPEVWYEAGFALIQIKRHAEAGMYLRRALVEYERKIQLDHEKDFSFYKKSCILALLGDTPQAFSALKTSVTFNPLYAESAWKAREFAHYRQEPAFQEILKEPLEKLKTLRFRGKKLKASSLRVQEKKYRTLFIEHLKKYGWKVEEFQSLWESDLPLGPQAAGEYEKNSTLSIKIAYYLDESLLFMELTNRAELNNSQAYRIYLDKSPLPVLQTITQHQDQVNYRNWEDFMEAIIEVCASLLFEMPDGRKVKVS